MRPSILALLLLLTACVAAPPIPANPPEYNDGWTDGCSSGKSAAGLMYARPRKDAVRFQNDALYADGWTDGYNHCRGRKEANDRLLGPAL